MENIQTLQTLYSKYHNGEIEECKYNGKIVYCGGLNAYDAGTEVYDKEGNLIGHCGFLWGKTEDAICKELKECEVIYRVKNNIWGLPFVDKYGLSK